MPDTLSISADDAMSIAMRLVIDGYAVIPDAVIGDELQALRDAFEAQSAKLNERAFDWDGYRQSPGLLQYICHPNLMAVIDAFMARFDEQAVFTCCSGARDVYTGPPETDEPPDIRKAGWHDDVVGMSNPLYTFTAESVSSLVYMDDTLIDSGAYCAAVGSHHLARRGPDDEAVIAPRELVFDHCALRQVPVTAGSIVLHRAHNWHGVMPPRQQRRLIITTFAVRRLYELQAGHTQLTDEDLARIPADRHKYITRYADAAT